MTFSWRRQQSAPQGTASAGPAGSVSANGADAPAGNLAAAAGNRLFSRWSARLHRWQRLPQPLRLFAILLAVIALWHGAIGSWQARIEADLSLYPTAEQLPPGGSVMLALAARLIERQTQELHYTPNDPTFYPTGLLVRAPAYQSGLIATLSAAIAAYAAGDESPLLSASVRLLATPPDHWWLRAAMPPMGLPADRLYGEVARNLAAYNQLRSADRQAAPGLPAAARRVLAALQKQVEEEAQALDEARRHGSHRQQAAALARARGTAYAATTLLRGLRQDHLASIRLSDRASRWNVAIDQLADATRLAPIVTRRENLVETGYVLMLAAAALRDIAEATRTPPTTPTETLP